MCIEQINTVLQLCSTWCGNRGERELKAVICLQSRPQAKLLRKTTLTPSTSLAKTFFFFKAHRPWLEQTIWLKLLPCNTVIYFLLMWGIALALAYGTVSQKQKVQKRFKFTYSTSVIVLIKLKLSGKERLNPFLICTTVLYLSLWDYASKKFKFNYSIINHSMAR